MDMAVGNTQVEVLRIVGVVYLRNWDMELVEERNKVVGPMEHLYVHFVVMQLFVY